MFEMKDLEQLPRNEFLILKLTNVFSLDLNLKLNASWLVCNMNTTYILVYRHVKFYELVFLSLIT